MPRAAAVPLWVLFVRMGTVALESRDDLEIYRKKRAGASPFFEKEISFRMNV